MPRLEPCEIVRFALRDLPCDFVAATQCKLTQGAACKVRSLELGSDEIVAVEVSSRLLDGVLGCFGGTLISGLTYGNPLQAIYSERVA